MQALELLRLAEDEATLNREEIKPVAIANIIKLCLSQSDSQSVHPSVSQLVENSVK